MKYGHYIAAILVIIGALNWGLVGLFRFDLVSFIFGASFLARAVYLLIGLAGLIEVVALVRQIRHHGSIDETPREAHV